MSVPLSTRQEGRTQTTKLLSSLLRQALSSGSPSSRTLRFTGSGSPCGRWDCRQAVSPPLCHGALLQGSKTPSSLATRAAPAPSVAPRLSSRFLPGTPNTYTRARPTPREHPNTTSGSPHEGKQKLWMDANYSSWTIFRRFITFKNV